MRPAWKACQAAVAEQAAWCAPLLPLIAVVGLPADHDLLARAAGNPALRRPAVRALGAAGRRAAADLCVELIRQGLEPRLAAEALCTITGLDLAAEKLIAQDEAPPADGAAAADPADDAGEVVLPGPDDRLPLPDAAGVARWWQGARARFEAERRYLGGRPRDPIALQAALERGPMRRRHAAALELAVRTAGRYTVATTAFGSEQRRQLAGFATLPMDIRRRAAEDYSPTS